ncbi:glycoside hydrolase family 3 protein [Aaosphaeria arxii CBS 175.79]|uniref:beta-glucosidase n=1 Tax=Aaosphaeria arxii CBS 175.79 TaxID=1450172 RepID=A0A6A5X8T1_9PLEO|nr:glycoside hydrolase family 3 protein [Aaosphaeria arxii CBS 175.79]KAF2009164.1 glycoside hydrolase family 3 protein [Aaosphaeria arxii CBS 175.79]
MVQGLLNFALSVFPFLRQTENTTIPNTNGTTNELNDAYSPPFYPSPWLDGSGDWAEAYTKAQAFVSQLTLLEKVNLTTGVGWQGEACVGNVGEIPRLGFPSLCMQDSPLGIRFADYVSAFPSGGTIAAAWDRAEWYRRGYQMGSEHRDKGVDVQLGPVVGPLGRNPKGGRNWEGFSPDPVLSGIAVAETVRGIQDAGVIACTKHYIMNEQEHFRSPGNFEDKGFVDAISSNLDDKTLHELYLWPFADAVRAGTGSIMCSYNKINNSQGCQNSYLQNYILKGELGFQGFIMSDWDAQHSGVASTFAGLDMTMPGDTDFDSGASFWGTNLTISVLNGTLPQWRLDDAATRIMAAYYYVGRDKVAKPTNFNSWALDTYGFQHFFAKEGYGLINQHVDVRDGHTQAIRLSAARSTVLLKNEGGVLPLSGKEKFTAVFGDDSTENPYGPNGCPDHGCDNGTLAMGWGSGTAFYPFLVTPLEAIKSEVLANGGVIQSVVDNWAYNQIDALAKQASVSLVFVNADSGEGYITVDGNMGDRNNLTFWQDGDKLIRNVSASCNNTVLVIHSVGPVIIEEYKNNPNITAIVWAGLPGEQSGNSIADVLYGRVNPGGKTPFTWGAQESDYGPDLIYEPTNNSSSPQDNFNEGVFIDYRIFDKKNITPTYEFGFGLSYTTFEYSDLNIQKIPAGPYTPTAGQTKAAPVLGNFSTDASEYQWPANLTYVDKYIYPYLNSTDLREASQDPEYGIEVELPAGAQDGSPQSRIPAGGAPGGNPQLWDVLFHVTATITNTGEVPGEEVVQLYVNLGPNEPKVVLRNFERLSVAPGQSATFNADVTRRDVSSWDTASQNWVITEDKKTVFVGGSSRSLPLTGELDLSGYATGGN